MFMEFLEFAFQDFWHFAGVLMMLHAVVGGGFATAVALRGRR